jgi:hypothetical protein
MISAYDFSIQPNVVDFGDQSGARFTNFTKFMIKNPDNFLQALPSRIISLACPLTWQDISDNS